MLAKKPVVNHLVCRRESPLNLFQTFIDFNGTTCSSCDVMEKPQGKRL